MKRYLVFSMYAYYPSGGWDDFCDSFDTLDEARAHAEGMIKKRSSGGGGYDWSHVIDSETSKQVWESE